MKTKTRAGVVALSIAALSTMGAVSGISGPAHAATKTGWVGPAGATGYLHTSTVTDSPTLTASSKIYNVLGTTAPNNEIGVRARLFKSGALCEAVDYEYNYYPSPEWTVNTTATCGSGWYNSHGFVAVWNSANAVYNEFVTFPSDPIQWTAPAAKAKSLRSVSVSEKQKISGKNSKGQKFGSAAESENGSKDFDLVLAIGDNGKVGYVKTAELDVKPTKKNSSKSDRTISVWNSEVTQKVDSFTIH